jgi:hypothetical protein
MILINQAFAADSVISNIPNPATKLTGITNLGGLLSNKNFSIINFVFIIVGLLFFANLVLTGWEFMMSSGDPKKVQAASTRLTNGFVGLILAVLAFVIVRLVTNILGLGNLV